MENYTIKFLGEAGVGKTCWMQILNYNGFDRHYFATVGCEAHPYSVNTNYGLIQFTIFDYYGDDEYASPNPIQPTDATVLMFDLSRKSTHTNLAHWHEMCHTERVIVVGNKSDLEHVVNPTYHIEHNLPYVAVSAKTGDVEDLLTHMMRCITGHVDLMITE
jgi:GTPase SAR1 family protein